MFMSRDDTIKYLRLKWLSNVQDEEKLLICVEIGRHAAKYGRKTLEEFTDEELEKTVEKIVSIVYDLTFEESD